MSAVESRKNRILKRPTDVNSGKKDGLRGHKARSRMEMERALLGLENPIIWESFSEITIARFTLPFFPAQTTTSSLLLSLSLSHRLEPLPSLTYANVQRHVPSWSRDRLDH